MGFNLGILISGRGSNMLNIVKASQAGIITSKVRIVVSNNKIQWELKKLKKKH